MGLPTKLTDEEQALLAKFAIIKKKRKAQNVKPTIHHHVEAVVAPTPLKKDVASENSIKTKIKEKVAPAVVIAPKDAKEKAKQLLASGQLKINKGSEVRSFKRARVSNADKKKDLTTEATSSKQQTKRIDTIKKDSFKNFQPAGGGHNKAYVDADDEKKNFDERKTPNNKNTFENNRNTYENKGNNNDNRNADNRNADNRNADNRNPENNNRNNYNNNNRQGNNLFVTGYGLSREILEKSFPKFGQLKKVYFDADKGHGFVTYHRNEHAAAAIEALHGEMVQGSTMRVVYARPRKNFDNNNKFDDNRCAWRPRGNNNNNNNNNNNSNNNNSNNSNNNNSNNNNDNSNNNNNNNNNSNNNSRQGEIPRDLDSAPPEHDKPPESNSAANEKKVTPRKLVEYDALTYDDNSFEF